MTGVSTFNMLRFEAFQVLSEVDRPRRVDNNRDLVLQFLVSLRAEA